MKGPYGLGQTDEWFIVEDINNPHYALGRCFVAFDEQRVGQRFGLSISNVVRVSPSKVPTYARVALAKMMLTL